MNKLILTILTLISISLVSANGINLDQNMFNIEKTFGQDYKFNLNLTNQETFTIYNITSSNNILEFDKIILQSGESKTIEVTIKKNEGYNGEIRIIGDYYAELGQSQKTENIIITSSGLDICNLDLIVGDTINWANQLLGDVKLKNLNSGEYFATINGESSYSNTFQSSSEFNYQVYKVGLPFSSVCHLIIQPTEGYIHSSQYDGILTLNLSINYEPTQVSTVFLEDFYNLSYNQDKEDVFKITNDGDKVAKNVKISGDWMTFNSDNFDLQLGESKNIGYTINPLIYETNQTGRTHTLRITIQGNFPTIEKEIEVFIKYKKLDYSNGNYSYDKEYLVNLVNLFCSIYPDDCPTRVIYGNESNKNVTFSLNEETYKESLIEEDAFREEMRAMLKQYNVQFSNLENVSNSSLKKLEESLRETEDLSEKTNSLIGTITLGGIIFLGIGIIILLGFIAFSERARIKLKNVFHKGELPL